MTTVAIFVFIAVILLAVACAKLYNVVHGFITFFGVPTLLSFAGFIAGKSGMDPGNGYYKAIEWTSKYMTNPLSEIFTYFGLNFMNDLDSFSFYVVIIGIWIISFVISVAIKIAKDRK